MKWSAKKLSIFHCFTNSEELRTCTLIYIGINFTIVLLFQSEAIMLSLEISIRVKKVIYSTPYTLSYSTQYCLLGWGFFCLLFKLLYITVQFSDLLPWLMQVSFGQQSFPFSPLCFTLCLSQEHEIFQLLNEISFFSMHAIQNKIFHPLNISPFT